MSEHPAPQERDLTQTVGPLVIEWPRTVGYYSAIGVAVAFDVIEPPVGLFIAAIPFLKMLNRPGAGRPLRLVSQFFDGAAQPVGGSAPSTITLDTARDGSRPAGIWTDARRIADRARARRLVAAS